MMHREENDFNSESPIATCVAESENSAKKAKFSRICPHCNQLLGEKTYKRHKKLFCKNDGTWIITSLDDKEFQGWLNLLLPTHSNPHVHKTFLCACSGGGRWQNQVELIYCTENISMVKIKIL